MNWHILSVVRSIIHLTLCGVSATAFFKVNFLISNFAVLSIVLRYFWVVPPQSGSFMILRLLIQRVLLFLIQILRCSIINSTCTLVSNLDD